MENVEQENLRLPNLRIRLFKTGTTGARTSLLGKAGQLKQKMDLIQRWMDGGSGLSLEHLEIRKPLIVGFKPGVVAFD